MTRALYPGRRATQFSARPPEATTAVARASASEKVGADHSSRSLRSPVIAVSRVVRHGRMHRLRRQARVFPRRFRLLIARAFFYLLVTSLALPFTAILLKRRLGVSMGVVGAIVGGTALAGPPPQLVAGSVSDRLGRRAIAWCGS